MSPLVADRIWFETNVSNGSPFFHQWYVRTSSLVSRLHGRTCMVQMQQLRTQSFKGLIHRAQARGRCRYQARLAAAHTMSCHHTYKNTFMLYVYPDQILTKLEFIYSPTKFERKIPIQFRKFWWPLKFISFRRPVCRRDVPIDCYCQPQLAVGTTAPPPHH
jgi:hypothetical protein